MNKLKGSRAYLAGPIDRAADFTTWRNEITPLLHNKGVTVFDPCAKPIKGYDEHVDFVAQKRIWKNNKEFDKIIACRAIRKLDLRLIDAVDFVVVRLDMSSRPFGTIEEMVIGNLQRKPILVWLTEGLENVPDWLVWMLGSMDTIFENREDLLTYLDKIDVGEIVNHRFVFFDHEKLERSDNVPTK